MVITSPPPAPASVRTARAPLQPGVARPCAEVITQGLRRVDWVTVAFALMFLVMLVWYMLSQ